MIERLNKQAEFLLEIDKLKNIQRRTYISDGKRVENDAEHSWHLAIMSMLLSEYAEEDIDVLRVMSMVLIHDLIEIDAGDTYAYDAAGNADKEERELKAADRIFNILPKDQAEHIRALWDEFEANETPEAHFANMLDRFQPTMLNAASGGISWREHNIGESQIVKRNELSMLGSKRLWDYCLHKYVKPNIYKYNVRYDYEEIEYERFTLAYERINSISYDNMNIPEKYKAYFCELADVFKAYYKCITWLQENSYIYAAPVYKWYKEISLEEWKEINHSVNRFRYDSAYYETSYANPTKAVGEFGENIGSRLCALAAKTFDIGSLCFEARYFELTILAELFLEIYNIFECSEEDELSGSIKSAIYYHTYDYMDETTEYRIRDSITCHKPFFAQIIDNIDINDERSLYLTGENIGFNETNSFKYINSLSEEEIDKIAHTYTDGYIKGFELAGIDLAEKETVQIRYPVGFERIVKKAMQIFAENELKSVILRRRQGVPQSGCIDCNPQFAYDHRFDKAIYYNKAIMDRQLSSLKNAYEKYKNEAEVYAGPAVIENFGEKDFEPATKKEALKLDKAQRDLSSEYDILSANLVNEYIDHEKYSFTIIAFPLPEIGDDYEKIFTDTIQINTLDTTMYQNVQQAIIDVLDDCEYVHIKGSDGNKTDLKISLCELFDEEKQTRFHNCLADVNIPVGEVYTSPKLTGTEGILNVSEVYINGLVYKNLMIRFEDGMTKEYSCSNYDNEEDNHAYVQDNLIKHESLPMGEFAIGTNTAAFAMGIKYNISDKLPILIAEKTGPHIAIGDTCFMMSEDIPTYNPDGKEMIARENEVSKARNENPKEAYFGCHTDITIPYNEIRCLSAVYEDGREVQIIKDGLFVLEGTTELNTHLKNI